MSEAGHEGVILELRRRAFQGGSRLLVIAGSLFLVVLTVVNILNVMGWAGVASIPLLAFSIFTGVLVGAGIIVEIEKMSSRVVVLRTDGISYLSRRNKRTDIPWSPRVHVDVVLDDGIERAPIGPMVGIGFYVPDYVGILVSAEDGWSIRDVWRLFRSSLGLVKERGLTMDDEMVRYIRYLKDREAMR